MKLRCQIAGKPISTGKHLAVKNPFNGQAVGAVTLAGREHVDAAIAAAVGFRSTPSRWQRFTVLDQARQLLAERREEFARLITSESGLCIRETRYEVGRATEHVRAGELAAALRLLRRSSLCMQYVTAQLDMLEQMSPWEYQTIRRALGHGSGFDSPGFREVRRVTPPLGEAFEDVVAGAGLDLVELYVRGREHEDLYQLAEGLIEWDERITMWRIRHYKVVARIIGDQVVGTQGTPVEVLGKMIHHNFFPALWRARNELTARAKAEEDEG